MISFEQNLGYEATIIPEIEDQSNVSGETIDDNWDRELFALVAENAHVLVRCPWMNDMEVSLTAAMNAYPEPMTSENVSTYLSVVLQLLANRVTETEKLAEEDRPEEAEPPKTEEVGQGSNTKTEVQKMQENSNTVVTEGQSKKEIDGAEHLELPASTVEKAYGSEGSSVIAAETRVVTNLIQGESKQSTLGAPKAEVAASSSSSSADKTSGASTGAPEVLAVTSSTSGSSARESVIDETGQEFTPVELPVENQLNETKFAIKAEVEAKQQIPTFETLEADDVANPIVEAIPAPDRPELAKSQETKSPTLLKAMEATPELELTELSPLDLESVAISDDTIEPSGEKIEMAEYESALATLDYRRGTNSHTNFAAEEILLDHLEEDDLELDELHMFSIPIWEDVEDKSEAGEEASIFQLNNESNLSGQMEIISPEQLVQNSLTIEEIEDTLIQLSKRIEASEPETTEKVNEILDKIIDVPVKLETYNGKNIITEAEAQEELGELFTELLDRMGIDYTPELIESLASLTLKLRLADEIEKLKNEEVAADKAPPGSSAHKIIKKLLAGLSKIKKAIAHACAIGKSALQLYTFNFAT